MITSDVLAGAAGVLLSLLFSFTPGLAPWFARQDPTQKRLVMLAAVVAVAVGAYGLGCAGVALPVACNSEGAIGLAQSVVVCLIANQATDRITPNVGAGRTEPQP